MYKKTLAVALLAVLTACSARTGSVPPQTTQSQSVHLEIQRAATCAPPLKFVSDGYKNVVNVYSNGTICLQIGGFTAVGPIAVDASDDLYVADTFGSDIVEFQPPYSSPYRTLSATGWNPSGVALCPGYIAVNDQFSGNTYIYKGQATSPTSVLNEPAAQATYDATCDEHGNLFTKYEMDSQRGQILVNEYVGGLGNPVELSNYVAGGGLVWRNGALWSVHWIRQHRSGPFSGVLSLWKPPFDVPSKRVTLQKADDPQALAVNSSGTQIMTTNVAAEGVDLYDLNGKEARTLPGQVLVRGIAYGRP